MNCPSKASILAILLLAVTSGCGRSSTTDLQEFGRLVFDALQDNETTVLARNLSVNAQDVQRYVKKVEELRPGVEWRLKDDLSDQDLESAARDVLSVFMSSYEDLLDGKLSSYSARVDKVMDSTSLILWVQKDGQYQGILIHSVILTSGGYKVIDWLGPIADPSKDFDSLRKKRAILESNDAEGCVYPRSGIRFEYSFVE